MVNNYLDFDDLEKSIESIEDPYAMIQTMSRGIGQLSPRRQSDNPAILNFSIKFSTLMSQRAQKNKLDLQDFAAYIAQKQTHIGDRNNQDRRQIIALKRDLQPLEAQKQKYTRKMKKIYKAEFFSYLWMVGGILLSTSICGLCCCFFPMGALGTMGAMCPLLVSAHMIFFLSTNISLTLMREKKSSYTIKKQRVCDTIAEHRTNIQRLENKLARRNCIRQVLTGLSKKLQFKIKGLPKKVTPVVKLKIPPAEEASEPASTKRLVYLF